MTEPKMPPMTVTPSQVIKVRPAQVHAAKLLVKQAELLGEEVSPAIRALAAAVIPADNGGTP